MSANISAGNNIRKLASEANSHKFFKEFFLKIPPRISSEISLDIHRFT